MEDLTPSCSSSTDLFPSFMSCKERLFSVPLGISCFIHFTAAPLFQRTYFFPVESNAIAPGIIRVGVDRAMQWKRQLKYKIIARDLNCP